MILIMTATGMLVTMDDVPARIHRQRKSDGWMMMDDFIKNINNKKKQNNNNINSGCH